MIIRKIRKNKKKYLALLLLADEQESMINRYLGRGRMFALFDGGLKTVCVVTDEGNRVCELKNIATRPEDQKKGYGREMIGFLCRRYRASFDTMTVGTGDSTLTVPFYRSCGFTEFGRVPNFFTDNYDHPIFERGRQLVDMVRLKRSLRESPSDPANRG